MVIKSESESSIAEQSNDRPSDYFIKNTNLMVDQSNLNTLLDDEPAKMNPTLETNQNSSRDHDLESLFGGEIKEKGQHKRTRNLKTQ